jgi:20S proteasome subunit beta 3
MEYNGGAVVAMVGKECVAIASDLRFGIQAQTLAMDLPKIHKINDHCFIGLAGLASDNQTLYDL